MSWVLVAGAAWLALALLTAIVIGRSIHLADSRVATDARLDGWEPDVEPATSPTGFPAPPVRAMTTPVPIPADDPPTLPGIPVARPPAPGAGGNEKDSAPPLRQTGSD